MVQCLFSFQRYSSVRSEFIVEIAFCEWDLPSYFFGVDQQPQAKQMTGLFRFIRVSSASMQNLVILNKLDITDLEVHVECFAFTQFLNVLHSLSFLRLECQAWEPCNCFEKVWAPECKQAILVVKQRRGFQVWLFIRTMFVFPKRWILSAQRCTDLQ